jgi:hypothetical protein
VRELLAAGGNAGGPFRARVFRLRKSDMAAVLVTPPTRADRLFCDR